jgi:uncharacterized protein
MTSTTDAPTSALAAVVSDIYAAFNRGDIPAILDRLAPDCRWEAWANNHAVRGGLPTMQPRIGPAGVAEFFAVVGQLDIHGFEVLDLLASERQVVAEISIDYTTPNGGRLVDEEIHLWTFDDQQRVVRYRHYVDTAKHLRVFGLLPQ